MVKERILSKNSVVITCLRRRGDFACCVYFIHFVVGVVGGCCCCCCWSDVCVFLFIQGCGCLLMCGWGLLHGVDLSYSCLVEQACDGPPGRDFGMFLSPGDTFCNLQVGGVGGVVGPVQAERYTRGGARRNYSMQFLADVIFFALLLLLLLSLKCLLQGVVVVAVHYLLLPMPSRIS